MRYPAGTKINKNNNINYSNRGMNLESEINETNNYYRINDIAIIYKKPTPITIHKVNYKSRNDTVIEDARFKIPSTTDYNGIYKSKYIDFEAKETSKKSFPLANIHSHQIEHLRKIINHGGIAFTIIRFSKENKTFYLEASKLIDFINNNTKKSIPLSFFEKNGYIIKDKLKPRIDYLEIIDRLYFKGDVNYEKNSKNN